MNGTLLYPSICILGPKRPFGSPENDQILILFLLPLIIWLWYFFRYFSFFHCRLESRGLNIAIAHLSLVDKWGQVLIENHSLVLVPFGAQITGIPLLKWLYRFLCQFKFPFLTLPVKYFKLKFVLITQTFKKNFFLEISCGKIFFWFQIVRGQNWSTSFLILLTCNVKIFLNFLFHLSP